MSTESPAPVNPPDLPPEAPDTSHNKTPLAHRAVRGSLWVVASSYWAIGFGFAANILLTRLLTPEVYGEYALATFFATLFQLRTKVGLTYAFAQERTLTGAAVGTVFTLDVALSALSMGIGLIAAPLLLQLGYSNAIVAMMLVLLGLGLGESFFLVFVVTLDKELHFKPVSIISSIIVPLSYLPALWLAWTGRGSLSLIAQSVALSLLSFVLYALFIQQRMGWIFKLGWRFQPAVARRFLVYGAQSGVASFVNTMIGQLDNFVVGTRSGTAALGYYDRGFRTAQWPNLLLGPLLARSALFTYAQLKDDAVRLRKTVSMVLWLITSMAAPIALALFIAAPDLVLWLYGERWLPAVPILRLLVIAALLRPIWDNAFVLFMGTGRALQATFIGILQLAIIFCLGWLLGGPFGPVGVGAAVVLAYMAALVVAHFLTADLLRLDLVDLFAKPLLAAALVVAGYAVLTQLPGMNEWPVAMRTLAKSGYAVLGYYLCGFLLQPQATRERIQYVIRLLRRQPG